MVLLKAMKVFAIINIIDFFDKNMIDYNNNDVIIKKNVSFLINSINNALITFNTYKKTVVKVYKKELNVLREKGLFLLVLLVYKYYK